MEINHMPYDAVVKLAATFSIDDAGELLKENHEREHHEQSIFPVWRYAVDVTKYKYAYVGQKLANAIGVPMNTILKDAIPQIFKRYKVFDQADENVHDTQLYPDRINEIKKMLAEKIVRLDEIPGLIMQTNFQLFDRNNKLIHVIRRDRFVKTTSDGLPLLIEGELFKIDQPYTGIIRSSIIHPQRGLLMPSNEYQSGYLTGALTDLHINILKLMCKGLSIESIAEELNRSIETIDKEKYKLRKITGCKKDTQLGLYAIKHHIVHLDELNIS